MIHAEYVEFDQPTGARVRRLEVFGHAGYAPGMAEPAADS